MRIPPAYTLFCAAMLSLFGYTKYYGIAMSGGASGSVRTSSSSYSSSGGGYHNTGSYGGSHK